MRHITATTGFAIALALAGLAPVAGEPLEAPWTAQPSGTASPSFLGLVLGQPMSVPECPRDVNGAYLTAAGPTCWWSPDGLPDNLNLHSNYAASTGSPGDVIEAGATHQFHVTDGRVAQISLYVGSYATRDRVTASLSTVFGPPTFNEDNTRYGEAHVEWRRPAYDIVYTARRDYRGSVWVVTRAYIDSVPRPMPAR